MESDQSDSRGPKAKARDWRSLRHNPVTLGLGAAQTRDAVSIRDLDGVFVFANDAAIRSMGKQHAEDVVGRRVSDLMSEADARMVDEDDRRVIASGGSLTETRITGEGEARRRWRVLRLALRNRRGRIIGVLSLGTELIGDLPESLLQTQEALRERNERLKFALDAAHMSFWTLDAATGAMTVGPDFRRIMALAPDAVVEPRSLDAHIVEVDRAAVRQVVAAAAAGGDSFSLNFRVRTADASLRWINAQGMAVAHEGRGRRVIGVVSDVTERMQAQTEREQLLGREQEARTLAEAATRARDQFLAIVSHELRSPLSGIQSWTHVLESQIGPQAPPPVRRAIQGVRTGVEQQVRLIDDLLDATRIMSGKLSLLREPVPMLPVVEAAVASVRDQARAKNIEIFNDYQVENEQVMGDRDRLQQIVWNLLSNAVKFTPDDGHVWVRLMRQGDALRLSVRDDGKGIPDDFRPVMFEWFRRQENTSHRSQDGLGLGLALVRHLCQMLGGSVTASSPGAGLGATFVVTLPVLQRVEHETLGRSVRKPIGAKPAPSLEGLRILLVDDQGDARESLSFVLREAGAEVVVCASAAEALAALDRLGEARAPSVLISDIAMPVQDGYWLLTQVREREAAVPGKRVPAIALTAYAQPEDRLRSLTSGFDMHVTKPVAAEELITIVATAAGHILRQ